MGLIPTFVEVTGEKPVGGLFAPPPILNTVKVGLSPSKIVDSCFNESSSKMMKKVFLFHVKNLFRFWNICFSPDIFVMLENGLIRNLRLNSKLRRNRMENKQLQYIYILSNILRAKGNQTIKINQLIYHSMRNIFFWKIIHKTGWRRLSQTLLKNIKIRHISASTAWNLIKFVLLYVQAEV